MQDDKYEDEYYDEEEAYDDEEAETLSCPNCGAEVYEDAVQCPACDTYITFSTSMWRGKSLWWIVLGLLGIVAVIYTFTFAI